MPVIWVIAAGFRTQISLLTGEFLFTPVMSNFAEVLFSKTSDFLVNYRNSLIVGIASTRALPDRRHARGLVAGAARLAALGGPRFPGLGAAVPDAAAARAGRRLVHHGARRSVCENSFAGLILAHTVLNLPMALWLMGVFVREVPLELEEAARIDGASTAVLLRHIVLPLVAPGLAACAILTFVFSWNEFAVALNLTMKQTATVPVAIAKFAQDFEIRYTQMAAAAALSILPALVLLLIGQRFIVRGLTQGAIK